jgi:SAM-dependent methyltransferase
MAMTQDCIRAHYEGAWQQKSDNATDLTQITYSSPIEDAIVYPLYKRMIASLKIRVDGGDVLDVGSGAGRWIRYFLENFNPRSLTGADYTRASVDLLRKWFPAQRIGDTALDFRQLDITDPDLDLGRTFDLINIANVLFHIPEEDKFTRALANLSKHVAEGGMVVTTEYLPRTTIRTQWMLVRDRYMFERAALAAGLKIVAVKAFAVFANDPMGVDGPDNGPRGYFSKVRAMISRIGAGARGQENEKFIIDFLTDIERAVLGFCAERIAEVDMPSQKLVFLAKA